MRTSGLVLCRIDPAEDHERGREPAPIVASAEIPVCIPRGGRRLS
jgi:hypothetical protein